MDKPFAQPPFAPTPPSTPLPKGACDAHVHLLAAAQDFPLWEGRIENPAEGIDFNEWLNLYQQHLDTMGFQRGLIVHSILFGADNSVTVEAVRRMGKNFKGVGLLPDGASEDRLDQFVDWNMVAVRLNYVHGGVLTWDGAKAMAPALSERGMHIQMLAHADLHMQDIADDIRALPVPVVFDHIGWPNGDVTPDSEGFQTLCALLAEGHVYVKLSGAYRFCPAPYDAATDCVSALIQANPERCLWGSDWPHIMLADAKLPHSSAMLDAVDAAIPDTATRNRIFVSNPETLFAYDPL